jgi:protein phosphatase
MGTTLVALLVVENTLIFSLNIGDSRLYEIRNGQIEQLTKDHSYVQHLLDIGEITYEEAKTSPIRNIIMRAVGIDDDVAGDVRSHDPAPGTEEAPRYMLLCSDGLSGVLSDEEIRNIVTTNNTLNKKTEELVRAANAAGGPDNITVVLAEI